jgi:hypothetical protein
MNAKRFALATLAGGITLFIVGYLLWGLALARFFEANTAIGAMREVPVFWALGLGQLAAAAVLGLFLDNWPGGRTLAGGLKAGAIIGFLLGIAVDFSMYGTTNVMNLTATVVDPMITALQMGAGGAVIGAMLGRGATAAA